jgi:hypothetical protein
LQALSFGIANSFKDKALPELRRNIDAARTPLPLANGLWRYQGHTTRWVKSETADTELAEKMDDLRARGEITQRTVEQMRTGKRPRGK